MKPYAPPSEDESDDDPDFPPLEDTFRQYKRPDVDEAEATVITDLLRSILQYDIQQQPTASQLLQHPWFAGSS